MEPIAARPSVPTPSVSHDASAHKFDRVAPKYEKSSDSLRSSSFDEVRKSVGMPVAERTVTMSTEDARAFAKKLAKEQHDRHIAKKDVYSFATLGLYREKSPEPTSRATSPGTNILA